jgi:hypothetical protein
LTNNKSGDSADGLVVLGVLLLALATYQLFGLWGAVAFMGILCIISGVALAMRRSSITK